MNQTDSFLKSFLEQYPEAQTGQLTPEELNKRLAEFQDNLNNRPLDDFDGLSPMQMSDLLYAPLTEHCVLQLGKSCESYLDQVPLFQLTELLLSEIEKTGGIKLTAKGNLPVRVCEWLLSKQLITWEDMKYLSVVREEEIPYLWPIKHYLLSEGFVRKVKNTLLLGKTGKRFMKESKTWRFMNLLLFFSSHFHWGNFYDIPDEGKCGQLGWAYSLWLLHKYGDEPRDSEFYSGKSMQAFEKKLLEQKNGEGPQKQIRQYHRAFAIRFFENFANWFGLVGIERRKGLNIHDQKIITKSPLFDKLFQLAT